MSAGPLARIVQARRRVRCIGFDDAPFEKVQGAPVPLCGVVCSGSRETVPRFEGMLWGQTVKDGTDATETIAALLSGSKFADQVHLVLLDGITVGGMNVVDLRALSQAVSLPCAAVVRKTPDLEAFRTVVQRLPDPEARWAKVTAAGPVYEHDSFYFQVAGTDPDDLGHALSVLTDQGNVPEPLRLAHLIGSAVMLGQSGRRA